MLSEDSLDLGLDDIDVYHGRFGGWEKISNKKYSAVFEQINVFDAEIVVTLIRLPIQPLTPMLLQNAKEYLPQFLMSTG